MRKWKRYVLAIVFMIGMPLLLMVTKLSLNMQGAVQEMNRSFYEERQEMQEEERITVSQGEPFAALLLGVDQWEQDAGRADTIIVLVVNPQQDETKILSIPRDTNTEMVGRGVWDKLNHAYAFGGLEMAQKSVEQLLGIPITYVAKVNMTGFTEMVDVVGPIQIDNTMSFTVGQHDFPLGELTLSGEEALDFARMRYNDPQGDFGRQHRQKQVIEALLEDLLSIKTLLHYETLLTILQKNIQMNITLPELLTMRSAYQSALQNFDTLYLNSGTDLFIEGIYYYQLEQQELQTVQQILQAHMATDA